MEQNYETLIATKNYELAIVHGQHRLYALKTKHHVDHCDLPKASAELLFDYLNNYKDYGMKKSEGKKAFDKECLQIMENEWDEYDKNEAADQE